VGDKISLEDWQMAILALVSGEVAKTIMILRGVSEVSIGKGLLTFI